MADELSPEPEHGPWRNAFARHRVGVEIDRAEGVFICDKDGNRLLRRELRAVRGATRVWLAAAPVK